MKVWTEYRLERVRSPLSFWVHRHLDGDVWIRAKTFDPPMPRAVPGRGWPIYILEHRGRQLFFASPEEIDHVVEVLGQKHLPTTRTLAEQAGWPHFQHEHWLAKLSKFWKPWKIREKLVHALTEFKRQL
jgi:hypothetical protein